MSNPCDDLELYMKLNKSELRFVLCDGVEVQEYQKHQVMRIFSILVFTPTLFLLFLVQYVYEMHGSFIIQMYTLGSISCA